MFSCQSFAHFAIQNFFSMLPVFVFSKCNFSVCFVTTLGTIVFHFKICGGNSLLLKNVFFCQKTSRRIQQNNWNWVEVSFLSAFVKCEKSKPKGSQICSGWVDWSTFGFIAPPYCTAPPTCSHQLARSSCCRFPESVGSPSAEGGWWLSSCWSSSG